MFGKTLFARLRAAHGLSFAMTAGQRPAEADLEDARLSGIDAERFEALFARREPTHREAPKEVIEDAVPGLTELPRPQFGLVEPLAPEH